MKAVYIHKIYLHLKINGMWKYADSIGGRYVYLYGEVPENRVEEFKNKVKSATIKNDVFGSDHCPVTLELDL